MDEVVLPLGNSNQAAQFGGCLSLSRHSDECEQFLTLEPLRCGGAISPFFQFSKGQQLFLRFVVSHDPEIGQCKEHLELEVVLVDASVVDIPESKLTVDDPKRNSLPSAVSGSTRRCPGFIAIRISAAQSVGEAFCAAVEPLVALGHRMHLRIPLALLVLGGAGRIDDVASRIVPSLSITPFSLRHWFTISKICSAIWCSSSR